MKKYFGIVRNSIELFLVYRLNFILWRVRVVVSILITYFLWSSVYQGSSAIFGYTKPQMLTYILLLTIINGVVLSTQTHRIAEEINTGYLSNFLLQPINFIGVNIARDLADKIINTLFSFMELLLLYLILHPIVFIQTNPFWLAVFLFSLLYAAVLYFEINMLLSLIGFWSNEIWAPRFIFFILITFLAGSYFPLDIFPRQIYNILQLLPFTYIIYFPLKTYLGQLSVEQFTLGFSVLLIWILLLYIFLTIIWQKGLKIYTAMGR